MAKNYYGSIDFSKLLEKAKAGDKAFSKADNGKIYMNVSFWVNEEPDQYGNVVSFQSSFKDATKEDRFYFGNAKLGAAKENKPVDGSEVPDENDMPF